MYNTPYMYKFVTHLNRSTKPFLGRGLSTGLHIFTVGKIMQPIYRYTDIGSMHFKSLGMYLNSTMVIFIIQNNDEQSHGQHPYSLNNIDHGTSVTNVTETVDYLLRSPTKAIFKRKSNVLPGLKNTGDAKSMTERFSA